MTAPKVAPANEEGPDVRPALPIVSR